MRYTRLPTQQEAEAAGFSVSDYEETAEVWPDNWQAFTVFDQMATQWKTGMSGPTGLDYQTLFVLLDRHGITGDEWWVMFDDMRHCEAAALNEIHKGN